MTITRHQLQQLRDMARQDAKGHKPDVDRRLNCLATELDACDAVLCREGIETIWDNGGQSPAPMFGEAPKAEI